MRILWVSNAPWASSGYGQQAALFLPRFQAAGHEVACVANFGLAGTGIVWKGIPVFPGDGITGNDAMPYWFDQFDADICIWLHDSWVLKPRKWEQVHTAVWAPVDHYPLPPAVGATLREPNVTPIAMSKFGEQQMRNKGLEPLYVPHGVDTDLFKPHNSPEARASVRADMGVPEDAFLVGMVAANSSKNEFPRKGYPHALMAFSQFLDKHPDAYMYCHTRPIGSLNLEALIINLGGIHHTPGWLIDHIKFPPEDSWHVGTPREQMPNMMNAFDVLLNASMGEGFGVPIIEAQACGVPVIASDHSAMTEITQAGWLVQGDPWWDESQTSFGFNPHVRSIEDALTAAYAERHNADMRAAAAAAMMPWDVDYVMAEYWTPALAALEAGLGQPRKMKPLPNPNGNRAQRRSKQKAKR